VKQGGEEYCAFKWKYGDNSSAEGILVRSEVGLAGVMVPSIFGGITDVRGRFYEAPQGNGIMGMSFGNYSQCSPNFPTCFNPLMDSLVAEKGLEDRWAMCTYGDDGALVVGGGGEGLYEGRMKHVTLLPPYRGYHIDILEVKVGEEDITTRRDPHEADSIPTPYRSLEVDVNPTTNSTTSTSSTETGNLRGSRVPTKGTYAIVDTGTAWMMFPEPMYAKFNESLLRVAPELKRLSIDLFRRGIAPIPESTMSKLPDITLRLQDDVMLTYKPQDYLTVYKNYDTGNEGEIVRLLTVLPANHFIMGQVALNKLYLEFDRGNKVLGIAPARPGCRAPA